MEPKREKVRTPLGDRMMARREELQMKRAHLAQAVGYTQQGPIQGIEEYGVVPLLETAVQIARALQTSVEWLVSGSDVAASAPASTHTLSPRADDPQALTELADMTEALGAPLTSHEIAWLRQMPSECSAQDYQSAIKAYRAGAKAAKVKAREGGGELAAPPLPDFELYQESGINERTRVESTVRRRKTQR